MKWKKRKGKRRGTDAAGPRSKAHIAPVCQKDFSARCPVFNCIECSSEQQTAVLLVFLRRQLRTTKGRSTQLETDGCDEAGGRRVGRGTTKTLHRALLTQA